MEKCVYKCVLALSLNLVFCSSLALALSSVGASGVDGFQGETVYLSVRSDQIGKIPSARIEDLADFVMVSESLSGELEVRVKTADGDVFECASGSNVLICSDPFFDFGMKRNELEQIVRPVATYFANGPFEKIPSFNKWLRCLVYTNEYDCTPGVFDEECDAVDGQSQNQFGVLISDRREEDFGVLISDRGVSNSDFGVLISDFALSSGLTNACFNNGKVEWTSD